MKSHDVSTTAKHLQLEGKTPRFEDARRNEVQQGRGETRLAPHPCSQEAELRSLQCATLLVFTYLCAGELLPLPATRAIADSWDVQQLVLLALLSCLMVAMSVTTPSGVGGRGSPISAASLLVGLNVIPTVAAALTTHWVPLSWLCVG